jgi:hypothetical protein
MGDENLDFSYENLEKDKVNDYQGNFSSNASNIIETKDLKVTVNKKFCVTSNSNNPRRYNRHCTTRYNKYFRKNKRKCCECESGTKSSIGYC